MSPQPRSANGPLEFRFSRMERLLGGHPVRTVSVDGERAEFVTDPALVHRVLIKDGKRYGKGELFQKARLLSRAGLLAQDDVLHRHYRRLAHPYLRGAAVADHTPVMAEVARDTAAAWRTGQEVDVQAAMCRAAAAIALRTLFAGLTREASSRLERQLAVVAWELISKPLYGNAAARARRQSTSRRSAQAFADLRALIAAQLDSPDATAGYLAALLSDPGRPGTPALSADEVCGEAVMMLTAATVTTASVMSWALYTLSEHPLIEEKVLKDLARTAAAGDSDRVGHGHGPPGYTLRFLMEVLRLYPPVWITCRRTLADVTLGDRALRAGTHVMFSSYLLHRDPARYPDPHRFDPDRWLTLRPSAHDASYLPFGAGARGCVGEAFAWKELEILLGAVVREWRLTLPPGGRVRAAAHTTLHPQRLLMLPEPR
ncbi:cytochrome P450 [Streptomyces sp. NPDC020489]|uniref:cytochrome P450 n=1 Tax=Streptomyces sp. NPDC020489 TaxID=3365077 RepID=UPI0037B171AB